MIRPWTLEDRIFVVPLLHACLEESAREGADVEPSGENIEKLWGAGVVRAKEGDPVLLAIDDAGRVVGFVLWVSVSGWLTVRGRTLYGLGTYVTPSKRGEGWSRELRNEAVRIAKARGYTRVIGTAHGPAGIASGEAAGFKPYGVQGELPL